jgi:hypothetical protein
MHETNIRAGELDVMVATLHRSSRGWQILFITCGRAEMRRAHRRIDLGRSPRGTTVSRVFESFVCFSLIFSLVLFFMVIDWFSDLRVRFFPEFFGI